MNQNIAKGRNQFEAKSKTGGADHIVLTVNILWQLWKARNDSIFNGKHQHPCEIVQKAQSEWIEFVAAQEMDKRVSI